MGTNLRQKNWVFQNAATAIGNGEVLYINSNMMTIALEITGTGVSTVTFEGKIANSETYYPIMTVDLSTFVTASSVSNKGVICQASLEGLVEFRARVSAFTSGTITVKGTVVD